MSYATTDLSDAHPGCAIVEPMFGDFGGRIDFHGPAHTLKIHEDNSLVRAALEQPGEGKVLVVDGGGSMRCALLGDQLAELAVKNGWAGVVVYGCIRDSAAIEEMDIGVKALATHPRKSEKRGAGIENKTVHVGGVTIHPGDMVYCDADGILVSPQPL
ncbi:MAG: ribonuclease E activity regulator RraA [Algiphilus sp.]|uniref:ribonuclease E activity regulator RraA n=1 Tax=Algiphilus sp. TaxID=1872431 RepID=UPI0032EA939E